MQKDHFEIFGKQLLATLKKGILGFFLPDVKSQKYWLENILMRCEKGRIRMVDPLNFEGLREMADPPALLYVKGELPAAVSSLFAIVGARRATSYGLKSAIYFARSLAERGVGIVSGLARGIDTAAHRGALEGGGKTYAVLGHGLDRIYPPENRPLAEQILEKGGALISEYPPGVLPLPRHFPARNRLLSALCRGVVVIQAAEKSGSLITARHALDQNREVFVVPAHFDEQSFAGSHALIQQGAKLTVSVKDITEEFPAQVLSIRCEETQQSELVDFLKKNGGEASLEAIARYFQSQAKDCWTALHADLTSGKVAEVGGQHYVWMPPPEH